MPKKAPSKLPLVSVCIPTKNRAVLLNEAIKYLLAQSYSNIEIIICDNASTDDTRTVAKSLATKDPRVRCVRQPRPVPAIDNFNTAISKARGEYIMLGADDDKWEPDYIATIMAEYSKDYNKEVALINSRFGVIDQRGKWQKQQRCSFSRLPHGDLNLATFLKEDLKGYKANVLFGIHRAECLRAIGGYQRISALAASDIITVAQILSRHRVRIVPKLLFYKREFYLSSQPRVWTDALAPLFQAKECLFNLLLPSRLIYLTKHAHIHYRHLADLGHRRLAALSAARIFWHLLPNRVENLKVRNKSFYGEA